jgi:chromate reductase
MSITEQQATSIPTGTWTADVVHSAVSFEVPYMGIASFTGAVTDFAATLADGRLAGRARIASLETKDENLQTHLLSPEFFDAGRFPEVSFATSAATADGSTVELPGDADRHHRRPGRRPVRERALRAAPRDDDRPHRVRDPVERADAGWLEGARRRGDPEGRPLAGEGGVALRVLAISGSLRRDSHNTALLRAAAEVAAPGVELVVWDGLRDVPPYDEDEDDRPPPPPVAALREAVAAADAVLIATPEYNHSIPGALKNALDWASRPHATNVFRNKPVAVIGSSAGMFGAVWAQADARKVLGAMGARVTDVELALGHAGEKIDADGRLADDDVRAQLAEALEALVAEAAPLLAA